MSTFLHFLSVQSLVQRWAPLVFLAPGEKFYPSDVSEFLDHVIAIPEKDTSSTVYENGEFTAEAREDASDDLPKGRLSESWYLTTRQEVDTLLRNSSSFIYGRNPQEYSVPVYALIEVCQPEIEGNFTLRRIDSPRIHFHVTYWMFYPFSQGKSLCTFDMGRFGAWPIPKLNNQCLGNIKEYGNHVGDWEHVSLYFEVSVFDTE
ncbi:hypothetical protein RUM43_007950 [Polyplax serrata]|uniref:Uncharacterized protein n=1 Tax=Polyplax serrata TaxID=468196 RepID=A0AAN8S862_POLSC